MKNIRLAQLALAATLMGATGLSFAQTDTATFDVTATVQASCSISATNLSFGTVDVLSGTDVDQTTTVSVTCTDGSPYDVGLDAGTVGLDVSSRQMDDGTGNTLNYALYNDAGLTTNWGNTQGTDTVSGTGNGTAQSLTVYGRIPTGQSTAIVGSYTDTVTATVYY